MRRGPLRAALPDELTINKRPSRALEVQLGCGCNSADPYCCDADHPHPDHSRIKVTEAIARSMLLTARYNGQPLTLAPHALFARRGDLFVSALIVAKYWRSADECRLGYFKLAGLADVEGLESRSRRCRTLQHCSPKQTMNYF